MNQLWITRTSAGIKRARMSGHRKWHNIKLKKGKVDAQRGALFTKLSKEIILAAKNGSADPEANYRLKMAVEKARADNMPHGQHQARDRARQRRRRRTADRGDPLRRLRPGRHRGDRRRRDRQPQSHGGGMRFLFSRNGGTLGETGSVGWMFESRGLIEVDPQGCRRRRAHRDARWSTA